MGIMAGWASLKPAASRQCWALWHD